MKVWMIYVMWDATGKVVNRKLRAAFRTKEMAERHAEKRYPAAQCGWKLLEYPLYG